MKIGIMTFSNRTSCGCPMQMQSFYRFHGKAFARHHLRQAIGQ